ncbi:putative ATP-dependent helicase [Salmonella enterica subsp. enterica]|uniref:Putative ATP-dependent helicase n=1 Tax=Salmonella enterica I TaxID=59201 RepID=A0A379VXM7_SALET|nr:putative ATP-dependent helicase [Salmonella enterica subsp. enterica]
MSLKNSEHDLFGEICSAVSSDASTVTESDISLFDNEQAYCEKVLGYLKACGQTVQYDTLPDNTLSLVAPGGVTPSL